MRKGWKPNGRDRSAGSVHDSPAVEAKGVGGRANIHLLVSDQRTYPST